MTFRSVFCHPWTLVWSQFWQLHQHLQIIDGYISITIFFNTFSVIKSFYFQNTLLFLLLFVSHNTFLICSCVGIARKDVSKEKRRLRLCSNCYFIKLDTLRHVRTKCVLPCFLFNKIILAAALIVWLSSWKKKVDLTLINTLLLWLVLHVDTVTSVVLHRSLETVWNNVTNVRWLIQ